MEASDFKALRESLGLSPFWLAHNVRMEEADLHAWENGELLIPDDAVELLTSISGILAEIEKCVINLYTQSKIAKKKLRTVALLQYICCEDLWKYQPELAPLPITTHNILLDRIKQKLATYNIRMITVYMIPEQYEVWRNENNWADDAASRAAWAGIQVMESEDEDILEGDIEIAVY
jgi:hypothetical protein